VPRNHTGFEALDDQVGNHFVDIEILH
jgi:hypothetical protein